MKGAQNGMEDSHTPSGSQSRLPSSSNEANLACITEAATIRAVDGSNTTFEYGRDLGTLRDGRCPSSRTSGIHSTRLGPYKMKQGCAHVS